MNCESSATHRVEVRREQNGAADFPAPASKSNSRMFLPVAPISSRDAAGREIRAHFARAAPRTVVGRIIHPAPK